MSRELATFFLVAIVAAEVALWVRDWFRDAIVEPFRDLVLTP
jgi:hypothetical protein